MDRGALVSVIPIDFSTRSQTCLHITLDWSGGSKKTACWGIPLVEISRPLVANSLNGQRIGRITKATIPLRLLISGYHQETVSLLIIDTPHTPVVLGHSWMVTHKRSGRLQGSGEWRTLQYDQPVSIRLPRWHPDLLQDHWRKHYTCPQSTPLTTGESLFHKSWEMRVLLILHRLPGIHNLHRKYQHGPWEGSGGGGVAQA